MLKSRNLFRFLFTCLLAAIPLAAQTQPVDLHLTESSRVHFVAYGDTRFTDPANTKAANPEVRRELVKAIANVRPDFVTFGGDITYNGNEANDWLVYESETAIWREGDSLFIEITEHIYTKFWWHKYHAMVFAEAMRLYPPVWIIGRYPELNHSLYYSVRAGNVLMLTLDSALDETSGDQGDWLKNKLAAVPAKVDFVVIVLHHPPYTSSSDAKKYGGGHSARPAEQALGRFLEERQKRMRARIVVFAGHVHNYERHEYGGVTYFVTGGGGADAYRIERQPTDPFQSDEVNYHFVEVKVELHKMVATMNRLELKNGVASWTQPDVVTITTPAK